MSADDARDAERGPDASLAPRRAAGPGRLRGRHGVRNKAKARKPDHDRHRLRAFLGAVADRLIDTAPRIPARDLATLRAQFPGQGPEEIADRLVSTAVRGSATVGAGVGAAAMLPVPPAMPAELAAEIIGVASIELKLIAELHELYGARPAGTATQRGTAYLNAWSSERGIDPVVPATVTVALGVQFRRELRHRLMKRSLRNLPNLTPFLIGAAAGAAMNRRETRKLAERIRADLRDRPRQPWPALPPAGQTSEDADSSAATRRSGRREDR
ncbi:hypothetical protein QNO07_21320 [Streptomyces sp. 549]|uniref:hypothetical protein n=1 Tax=Streptomyces sp. 549 TaxID=3049076 RepID=UPI0024C2D1BF|nr:hypothetical protein [Streptomyces sp. 549]MDK1475924.1 hypothetical protein [Streptomyces sp. 549]